MNVSLYLSAKKSPFVNFMNDHQEIVLATRNKGKIAEMRSVLAGLPVHLLSVFDFPEAPHVVEDELTLCGNARKKALALYRHTGLPALADDTGLEVEALDGRPGVHSARYAGPEAIDAANRALLLKQLKGESNRRAQFRTVIALTVSGEVQYFEGVCSGQIIDEERGTGGFGYDALFVPEEESLTFAEMDAAQKNAISHRARALQKLAARLSSSF